MSVCTRIYVLFPITTMDLRDLINYLTINKRQVCDFLTHCVVILTHDIKISHK